MVLIFKTLTKCFVLNIYLHRYYKLEFYFFIAPLLTERSGTFSGGLGSEYFSSDRGSLSVLSQYRFYS